MNITEQRRKYQLDFLSSKQDIEVGIKNNLPLSMEEILKIDKDSKYVEQVFENGLTAIVYKIKVNNQLYNLKKKRNHILVKNIDGQTSFLNEVQRRKNFYDFKQAEPEKFANIVNTIYASLNLGFILSEWIDGEIVSQFDEKSISDIYRTHFEIEKKGLFECDLSQNNLLIDKHNNIRFFDFGYMYPYNSLFHYNSDGKETPIFHLAERFESRSLMQYLMNIESNQELMFQTFEFDKKIALETYINKYDWLIKNNADLEVIHWQKEFINQWSYGLKSRDNLKEIFELESFRSYVLDVEDDISGKSCTPMTIKKIERILQNIKYNYNILESQNGLFWGDEKLSQTELYDKYKRIEEKVLEYQINKPLN